MTNPPPKKTERSVEVYPSLYSFVKESKMIDGVDKAELQAKLAGRVLVGEKCYGTRLTTFNGRNARLDAVEESLDLMFYIQQKGMEDEGWFKRKGESALEMTICVYRLLMAER